jgi:heme-degrading monooxygenase HmoA
MFHMPPVAHPPQPPYYAVIFTSLRTPGDQGYASMAARMSEPYQKPGFLGIESAREGVGITVSYWASLEAIAHWKQLAEHLAAQTLGHQQWHTHFRVRIAKVEREYGGPAD